jgi:osmotically-inducible protein OsmY
MSVLLAFEWPIAEAVVERLGWVLVHSLWQFAFVALLAGVTVQALRRCSAATRYGVLVVALALVGAAPVATWIIQPGVARDPSAGPGQAANAATGSGANTSPLANHSRPADKIMVTVRNGWITFEGEVQWQFQKKAAEITVRYLKGVKGVSNHITVKSRVTKEVQSRIEEALQRSAELDANRIAVEVEGDKVTLRATVRSLVEKEEAERVARAAPGSLKWTTRLS